MVRFSRLLFAMLVAAGLTVPALAFADDGGYLAQKLSATIGSAHTKNYGCQNSNVEFPASSCSMSHSGHRRSQVEDRAHDARH